jgi:hypothetical protein
LLFYLNPFKNQNSIWKIIMIHGKMFILNKKNEKKNEKNVYNLNPSNNFDSKWDNLESH